MSKRKIKTKRSGSVLAGTVFAVSAGAIILFSQINPMKENIQKKCDPCPDARIAHVVSRPDSGTQIMGVKKPDAKMAAAPRKKRLTCRKIKRDIKKRMRGMLAAMWDPSIKLTSASVAKIVETVTIPRRGRIKGISEFYDEYGNAAGHLGVSITHFAKMAPRCYCVDLLLYHSLKGDRMRPEKTCRVRFIAEYNGDQVTSLKVR